MANIPLKRQADLFHRVGTSYKAGVDLKKIWQREASHGSPAHRLRMQKLADRIGQGDSLAQGMEATNGYFPELTIAVIKAGEEGGRLERAFALLSHHYDTLVGFRRDMLSRLTWPFLELFFAIVVIGLMILAMGWATSISGGEPVDWLGFGWSTGQYFWSYVTLMIVIISTMGLLFYGVKVGWFGLVPMQIARRIPLLGKTIEIFALARFAWVLSAVYEAGMNMINGVRLSFRATQNYYYQQFADGVVAKIQAGDELHTSLRATQAFPDDLLMYVENGELTGELPISMQRLAEQYTAEAEKNLQLISKVLFMILFTIIALIIGSMIIMLYARYLGQIRSLM